MTNDLNREKQISLIYDKWQKMTIISDPMFGLVMQNKGICLELINRALPQLKAQSIVQLDTQKDINLVGAHRVRFDVYVRDESNNIFVIEMRSTTNTICLHGSVIIKNKLITTYCILVMITLYLTDIPLISSYFVTSITLAVAGHDTNSIWHARKILN